MLPVLIIVERFCADLARSHCSKLRLICVVRDDQSRSNFSDFTLKTQIIDNEDCVDFPTEHGFSQKKFGNGGSIVYKFTYMKMMFPRNSHNNTE